jgi:hypothetical protein
MSIQPEAKLKTRLGRTAHKKRYALTADYLYF